MSSTMQQRRKNKWDILRDQRKTFMNTETIASMSRRVSNVPYIVGTKEVFFFQLWSTSPKFFEKIYIVTLNLIMI